MKKNIIKKLVATAITMVTMATFSTNVFAVNFWDIGEISAVTQKKLSAQPTTETENRWVSTPDIVTPLPEYDDGYIIIGDSRTVCMDLFANINAVKDNWVTVGCSGQGLSYMSQVGIPTALKVAAGHPEIKRWHYVIAMGVNDLANKNAYKSYIQNFASANDVYFVSVNPVIDNPNMAALGYSNAAIRDFNATMAGIPGVKYIDTNSVLTRNGFNISDDCLHYKQDTSNMIFNLIRSGVR